MRAYRNYSNEVISPYIISPRTPRQTSISDLNTRLPQKSRGVIGKWSYARRPFQKSCHKLHRCSLRAHAQGSCFLRNIGCAASRSSKEYISVKKTKLVNSRDAQQDQSCTFSCEQSFFSVKARVGGGLVTLAERPQRMMYAGGVANMVMLRFSRRMRHSSGRASSGGYQGSSPARNMNSALVASGMLTKDWSR